VEDAVFAACFAAYFWRFCTFDGVGFRTLYLEVMRVYKGKHGDGEGSAGDIPLWVAL
jgi:hypothetical protein